MAWLPQYILFPLPQNTFQNSFENHWGEDVAVFDPTLNAKEPTPTHWPV